YTKHYYQKRIDQCGEYCWWKEYCNQRKNYTGPGFNDRDIFIGIFGIQFLGVLCKKDYTDK
ncbi:hypothetical protein JZU68_07455, partial [bacterium]|nr:hypothetical protein [bacterium]